MHTVPVSLGNDLITEEEDESKGERKVGGDESGSVPVTVKEHFPSGEEDDDGSTNQHIVTSESAKRTLVGKSVTIHTLGLHAGMEAEVGNGNTGPGDKTADGSHRCEPTEDGPGTAADTHVGKKRESDRDDQSGPGKTALGSLSKDLGSTSRNSKTEESTGRSVHIGRGSRPGRGKQTGVNDTGKDRNASGFDGNNEGR